MGVRTLRNGLAWIGLTGFAAMLAAPLAGQALSPARDASALENRRLADRPTPAQAIADWSGFPARVSVWLEDRFGFRDQLLAVYFALDKEVRLGVERVAVRGDDGWLYLTNADSLLSHQGRLPFAAGEADAWLDRASDFAARAEAAGARFVALVPPDKQTVYPEHLSAYPSLVSTERRRDALARLAPERGIVLVSPVDALRAAKAEGGVYYRTDTHWSPRGAYVGYRALIDAIRETGLAVDAVGDDRISWTPTDGFVGDIYGLLGDANGAPETYDAAVMADAARIVETLELPELAWEGFVARRFVMEPRGMPSVLVLGDSFADGLMPFLQQSFDEVTFAHHRLGAFPPEALEPGRYDVVVFEMVERFLNRPLEEAPGEDP